MPKYFYKAKSKTGEEKSGILEAQDEYHLARILREEGLILIKAEIEKKKRSYHYSLSLGKISLAEKMFFTRNLQVMVSAGVSLPRAISSLAKQVKSKNFKEILEKISQDITKGKKLSESISQFPQVFNDFYQNMIKVAEETGNLEEVLGILARQIEKENEIKSRIIGASIYPVVILLAMLGIGILMLVMVIPKIIETFKTLEVKLPPATRFVVGLTELLTQKGHIIIVVFFISFFLFYKIVKTKKGKKILDKIFLKIPIISGLIQKINTATAARNLSSLLSSGISLPRALEITGNTLGNSLYKESLLSAAERIVKGEKLSLFLKSYLKIYPGTFVQMIEVGEETGETTTVLMKLAEFYEEEVSNVTKNLVSVIEPILMVIIGAAVGFFAVSMFQPIYSMMEAIK